MKMSSRMGRRYAGVALAVLAAAFASGCAAKSASNNGGSNEAVTVKIGMGGPLTAGAVALGQGLSRGTELAIIEANKSAKAKELGIQFEMFSGDDAGDPKTGVNVANQFASDPALVGVMGHLNSGVSIAASKVYNENKIVMIAPASTNPILTEQGFDNIFRVCTIDTVQGSYAADQAVKTLGMKTAFVVDDSTPYGEGLAKFFAQQFEANGGKVVGQEKTSDKDTDFTALATKINAANPDVIYYGGIYNSGALLAKQAKEAGARAVMFGGDGFYDEQYVKLAGTASEGAFSTCTGLPLDQMPKGQDFKAAYEREFPGEDMGSYDAYAFDATNVIIDAVYKAAEQVGAKAVTAPPGREAIIKAVAETNSEGVTGKLGFDAKGDALNKALTLYTVKSGKWVVYSK